MHRHFYNSAHVPPKLPPLDLQATEGPTYCCRCSSGAQTSQAEHKQHFPSPALRRQILLTLKLLILQQDNVLALTLPQQPICARPNSDFVHLILQPD